MTTLIIGLIAALGIGGGIAVASHGGSSGGGAEISGPVVPGGEDGGDAGKEDPVKPEEKPSVISALVLADNPQNIQFDKDSPVRLDNGSFVVKGERPRTLSDGTVEYEAYEMPMGVEDYSHSDSYAHYYQKESDVSSGGEQAPANFQKQAKKMASLSRAGKAGASSAWVDTLALGGQVLGLQSGDFGYHSSASGGQEESAQYGLFHMYDITKLASTARTDTALYQGHVLGFAGSISQTEALQKVRPLSGDIQVDINFANKTLDGNVQTKITNKNWYGFNFLGSLKSNSAFVIDSVAVDGGKTPDEALADYMLEEVSGAGLGVLLAGLSGNELIGNLGLSGKNGDSAVLADMAFGALGVNKPQEENPAEENPAGGLNPNFNLISALADNNQYKNIVYVADSGPDDVRLVNDDQEPAHERGLKLGNDGESFLISTGVLVEQDGAFVPAKDGRFKEELQQWRLTAENKADETDKYRLYQAEVLSNVLLHDSPVTHLHKLYLGGAKVGLTTADFGLWIEYRNGDELSWRDRYREVYLYDKSYLYAGSRLDRVDFAGVALMVSPEQEEHSVAFEIESGSFNMSLDLAKAALTGEIVMKNAQHNVEFSGTLTDHNQLKFTGEDVHEMSHGYLLQGKDGLETIGNIAAYFDPSHDGDHAGVYTFGAKEVK